MFEALIFDVDGTLADTERDGHRLAFNRAFQSFGLDWEWDVGLYGELLQVTGGKERMRHYVQRHRPDLASSDLDALIPALHRQKTQHYTEHLAQGGIPMRPGVRRLLQEARAAGVRLAIATTTTPDNVSVLLRSSLDPSAEAWFEVIGAGDVVAAKKPAPDIYLWVLERLGLPAHRCLALEDSENGLRASRRAGIPTVVTISDYTRDQDFSGAVAVLTDLGDPGEPMTQLAGPDLGREYVDLALLRRWHEAAGAGPA
ncbi:MAG: HAD family hydrolase [Betaproteobacteria bacterium]|nr:HAD family hydrolase [Betaproteobacteria bacterium]